MNKAQYKFSGKTTTYYFGADLSYLGNLVDKDRTVLVTDEHVFSMHQKKFGGWDTIVVHPGEQYKVQTTVNSIIEQLIGFGADRKTWLVGIGGGVVTDLVGYVAAVYMRGLAFGFVPSSVLAMVDASIGGKNGIDVGLYKNLVGTIRQPEFLLYDYSLLRTLPKAEWVNGFAEIIKHAAIKDAALFKELERNSLTVYSKNRTALARLIRRNAVIKSGVVERDEFEHGERRLLNFGHTLGHAIENLYAVPHGHAVAIGMVAACRVSEELTGFDGTERVIGVLRRYGLPTVATGDARDVIGLLRMDKKRVKDSMNYVLLNRIGEGTVKVIPIARLEKWLQSILDSGASRSPVDKAVRAAGAEFTTGTSIVRSLRPKRDISANLSRRTKTAR
ncbi:MAG TPA: 3-dehydroquinate synthase [Puia sp.]|nr:3-dehydroquinate synthase [Puia sp.]